MIVCYERRRQRLQNQIRQQFENKYPRFPYRKVNTNTTTNRTKTSHRFLSVRSSAAQKTLSKAHPNFQISASIAIRLIAASQPTPSSGLLAYGRASPFFNSGRLSRHNQNQSSDSSPVVELHHAKISSRRHPNQKLTSKPSRLVLPR